MEKALTFEEFNRSWNRVNVASGTGLTNMLREAWDAARVGMIPEDEAVRIDWSDPKLSTRAGIVVLPVSQEHVSTAQDVWGADKLYKYIPHPAPAWTPKVGDKIFFLVDTIIGETVSVGIVSDVDAHGYCAVNGKNDTHWKKRKPFDASKIGKPWEEIPGGVE